MGISNLLKCLEEFMVPCNLSHISIRGREKVRVGIDVSCYLYKGITSREGPCGYVLNLARFVRGQGLFPVLVLEGESYGPKKVAYQRRYAYNGGNRPNSIVRDAATAANLIKGCEDEGFGYTTSVYEADAQLAKLVVDGHIDLVMTEDSDLIVYECPLIFYKIDLNTGSGMLFDVNVMELAFEAQYNADIFRRVCLMIRSDYTNGLRRFGIGAAKKIYNLLKPTDGMKQVISKIWEHFPNLDVEENFQQEIEEGELAFKHHPVFEVATGKVVPLQPYPSSGEATKAKLVTGEEYKSLFRCNINNSESTPTWVEYSFVPGTPFNCPRCTTSCASRQDLADHYQTHRVCTICNRKFDFPNQVDIHLVCHTKDRPVPCPHCEKNFKNEIGLRAHSVFHGIPRYICKTCLRRFHTSSCLRKHEKYRHAGSRPFHCVFCPKRFFDNSILERHIRSHTLVKPHICKLCGKEFLEKHKFLMHVNKHKGKQAYLCETCGLSFTNDNALWSHRIMHESTPRYVCEFCQRGFHHSSQLAAHRRIHLGIRPYNCVFCSRNFTQNATLENHMRTHMLEKPFFCKICGKEFGANSTRLFHVNLHTRTKKYVCKTCGKNFAGNNILWNHQKVHSNAKPFKCDACQSTLKSKYSLSRHQTTCKQFLKLK